jgi:ATP-dependent DNA helicase RecQ
MKIYERYKDELGNGLEINFEEVAGIIGVSKDSISRLIKKLSDAGAIEYTPPFRGTEIKILKRTPKEEVDIDFSGLREKLKRAHQKLNTMENYIYHGSCRQKYILDYFGDHTAKPCAKCDNCLTGGGYIRKTSAPAKTVYSRRSTYKSPRPPMFAGEIFSEENLAPKAKLPTKLTQLETFDLYNKGMNIKEIAAARELTEGTIINHLCFLIEKKLPVDINKFVSQAKQKKIKEAFKKIGGDKLAPIKEYLGEEAEYDEIKFILAKIKAETK